MPHTSLLALHDRKSFQAAYNQLEPKLSLAVIDIDYFRKINENYSRDIGDAVLRSLENILSANLPKHAQLGRIGGDEYAVLLPQEDASSAFIIMEEIRHYFSSHPIHPAIPHTLSLSIGIANEPQHASTFIPLIRAAEQALFRAKAAGRGRSAIYQNATMPPTMLSKHNHYQQSNLQQLTNLSKTLKRTEAGLLREALEDLLCKYAPQL